MLDLYAGSGALGLEALSRGAESADFVDTAPEAIKAIRENGGVLGALERMRIHRGEALRFAQKLEAGAFDIVFADPPYNLGMAPRLAAQWLRVPFARILGIEHDAHESLPDGGDTRVYGGTAVTIFRGAEQRRALRAQGPNSAGPKERRARTAQGPESAGPEEE